MFADKRVGNLQIVIESWSHLNQIVVFLQLYLKRHRGNENQLKKLLCGKYESKIQNGNLYLEGEKITKFCNTTIVEAIKNDEKALSSSGKNRWAWIVVRNRENVIFAARISRLSIKIRHLALNFVQWTRYTRDKKVEFSFQGKNNHNS